MKTQDQPTPQHRDHKETTEQDEAPRKPFVPPKLRRDETLARLTAGYDTFTVVGS